VFGDPVGRGFADLDVVTVRLVAVDGDVAQPVLSLFALRESVEPLVRLLVARDQLVELVVVPLSE